MSYTVLNGKLIIDNREIFLMNGLLFIFLASFLVYFMEIKNSKFKVQSSKFLMANSCKKKALDVLQKIYSQNTGNWP